MGHLFSREHSKRLRAVGFLLMGFLLFVGIRFYYFLNTPVLLGSNGYILLIPSGTPVRGVVKQLSKANVLEHPIRFLLSIYLTGASHKIQAGEYQIKAGTSHRDLIEQLSNGKVMQHALTIVPGWNFERLMTEVRQSKKLKQTLVGLSDAQIMEKLGEPGIHPEGQFFPETYYFPLGTMDVDFLKRAHRLLQDKLLALWDKHSENTPLRSPYDALILASIIEKESHVSEEYAEISGVYHRRLQKNMPLQADPTVAYGLGAEFSGVLSKKMLKEKTPYNTYQNRGLTPTPIAFSSEKAIEAALSPRVGDTLYFVARSDGKGHVFSKTLKEHQVAVAQYRKSLLETK